MESGSAAEPHAAPEPRADQEAREQRVRELVSNYQLLVCNPSPAYAAILRSNLDKHADDSSPVLLGVCATAAEALALLPAAAEAVLLVSTSQLRDGSCVPLIETLLGQTAPPHLLVVQVVDAPALPLASLLPYPEVNLIWEENIGKGVLASALEHMARGERFVDPACRQSIAAAVAASGALTTRELEVLALVAAGLTNRQIAARLVVAEVTARDHVQRILRKLAVGDRTAAAVAGLRLGLLS
jgi:DNA-binding NarL/FixJ family response regulator